MSGSSPSAKLRKIDHSEADALSSIIGGVDRRAEQRDEKTQNKLQELNKRYEHSEKERQRLEHELEEVKRTTVSSAEVWAMRQQFAKVLFVQLATGSIYRQLHLYSSPTTEQNIFVSEL